MRNNKKNIKVIKIEPNHTKEFDEKIKTMSGVVLFHHPGCIHCIMLRPKWEMMKKKLKGAGDIMEVNAGALENSKSPMKEHVAGFPMLIGVKNGDMKEKFGDERSIENMLKFVTKHMDHSTNNLTYNYKLNKHKNIKKITKKNNKRKNNKTKRQQ
jgi:thiol-disulfide isomerase/thioredoxin